VSDSSLQPVANPALEISEMDADGRRKMALCAIPVEGRQAQYAIPKTLLPLISLFDGRRSIDSAIAQYKADNPGSWQAEKLKELVTDFLIPRGLVLPHPGAESTAAPAVSDRRSFLYLQLPLIGPRVIEPIARALGWAYSRIALAIWLPLFLFMIGYFLLVLVPAHDLDFNRLNFGSVVLLLALSTLSTLVHEFGHASAAMHFGCRNMRIGWGLYLAFTVMWTDVSDAWKLPRWQRAIIDVGGVYLESFFVLALFVIFEITGNPIYLFGVLFSLLNMSMSFNPFLRLDGYWLMSDALGIVNLREKQIAWLRRTAARLLNRPEWASARGSDLGRTAQIALGIYSVLGIGFFFYLLTVIWDRVILSVATQYPGALAKFWLDLGSGASLATVSGGLLEILWRTLMLVALGFMLVRLSRLLAKPLRSLAG